MKIRIVHTTNPTHHPYYAERLVLGEWIYVSGSGSNNPEASENLARGIVNEERKTVKEFEV